MHCCISLSIIVGMPNGLVLPFSFGISTLRTFCGIYQSNFLIVLIFNTYDILFITFGSIMSRHSVKSPPMMCFLASRTNQR